MKPEFNLPEFIHSLEKKYPVDEWEINGIHVWPIIRVRIQSKINLELGGFARKRSANYADAISVKVSILKKSLQSYFRYFSLKKVDFIATSTFAYLSVHQEKFYNKFYDPILEEVNANGLLIEHNTKNFKKNKPLYNPSKSLYFEDFSTYLNYYYKLLARLKWFNPLKNAKLKEYHHFVNDLKSVDFIKDFQHDFEVKSLKNILLRVHIFSKVYKRILRRTKPKFTFQVCHYNTNSIALSIASRQLGIPSVEIQHGGQPPHHMAYSNWTKVPANGYNTLPKIYWHWDQESRANQAMWIDKNKFHRSTVLGNIWIDYIKKQAFQVEREYILYSLQPFDLEMLFPEYLIHSIKTNKIRWWLRIHPGDVSRKDAYIQFFKDKKIDDLVVFDEGNKFSLPETLLKSLAHVTFSSGVVKEAEDFGLKSLILDSKKGSKSYQNQINRGNAFVVDEANFKEKLEYAIQNALPIKQNEPKYLHCFTELQKLTTQRMV